MQPTFSALLRQLRRRAGMTQGDLAAAVGCSASFISNLEQNARHPDVALVAARFVSALALHDEPNLAAALVQAASTARNRCLPGLADAGAVIAAVDGGQAADMTSAALGRGALPRADLLDLIVRQLTAGQVRLFTLVGPAGVGKTQLALAAAQVLEPLYRDGAVVIALAAADGSLSTSGVVAAALGIDVRLASTASLIECLYPRELLLVLDGCEQRDDIALLVADLLARCPDLRILATGHQRLRVRAEQCVALPPLILEGPVRLDGPSPTLPSRRKWFVFGALLRQLRRRAGLTQGELGGRVHLSPAQVSRLEQGERAPDPTHIVALFIPALGLAADSLAAQRLQMLAAGEMGEGQLSALRPATSLPAVCSAPRLPLSPTPLFGRAGETARAVQRLLEAPGRLLTLIGPPGVGKTQLALLIANEVQPFFEDGVTFVSLAAVMEAEDVPAAVMATLSVLRSHDQPPAEQVIALLRRHAALLVLDNFEHVLPAAGWVRRLLEECPALRLLITSHERLHLRHERWLQVPPLDEDAAVDLFAWHARAADPGFVLDDANVAAVRELCRRLDGIPLAIELVASQVDCIPLPTMLQQPAFRRLELAAGGPRDLPSRQRSLRSALDHSYDRLHPSEQTLLRQLAVCVGGFEAEAVAALSDTPEALQALVAKSLVQPLAADPTPRWYLLETVREYAGEHLVNAGELAAAQDRHARYYCELALAEAGRAQRGAGQEAYDRLERELENLRAALKWAIAWDIEMALRSAGALGEFWAQRGTITKGPILPPLPGG